MTKKEVIIVDGANIAYLEKSHKGDPKILNLLGVQNALKERGYEPIILVDASLQYAIDDRPQLDGLIEAQEIRQVPAGTDADYFVLETAERYGAKVVSNDQFDRFRDQYPWIENRRIPLMIINGRVELYAGSLENR